MIRIVTDSTCDLPAEVIAKYGICVVPLYINIGDKGYLDGVEITREEFYRNLPTYPVHPTTAASSPEKYRKVYDELAREGATQVLSIHISSALSAVIDTARIAAQGNTMGEIVKALNDQNKRSHVFAALDTLEFLKRSGRMNGMIAAMGTLLQLKPILTMFDGKAGAERVRTRERATQRLLEMLHDVGNVERIAIVHTHSPERVAELRQQAAHLLPDGEILSMDITPVIGAHIGPGAVGFAIVGKSKG
ncbi:DegV domain-containing protein [Anaerolineae bacterium]|nr:DegV domain-containing protein [Anaerolineae bacterium]